MVIYVLKYSFKAFIEDNPGVHIIETNYQMSLNEEFPFSKNGPELAFQWTEQERQYAEDGISCDNIQGLTKKVFFIFYFIFPFFNFWHIFS